MSSKSDLLIVTPAPYSAIIEMGGNKPFMRRALIAQRNNTDTVAYYTGAGQLLCVAMFKPWSKRKTEMALLLRPLATAYLRPLMRIGHLTLSKIRQQSILVFARINPLNQQSKRMAYIIGFRPGKFRDEYIWIFKGEIKMGGLFGKKARRQAKEAQRKAEEEAQKSRELQDIANQRQLAQMQAQDAREQPARKKVRGRALFSDNDDNGKLA